MDLHKIDKPFGELDRATQITLFEAYLDGGQIEFYSPFLGGYHHCHKPVWMKSTKYRLYKEPEEPDYINWSHVNERFNYMARDKNGETYLFAGRPEKLVSSWSGGGYYYAINSMFSSHKQGTVGWEDSLVKRS